jgi:hypothetical protein
MVVYCRFAVQKKSAAKLIALQQICDFSGNQC